MKRLGLDIGSTTLKCAVLDDDCHVLFSVYERHFSRIAEKFAEVLGQIEERFPGETFSIALSGSAGMGIADAVSLPFVQEVYAEQIAVRRFYPETDAVIELGGEDAKILFLTGGFEMRMNGTCAGGTGAFIDQMASLLQVQPDELNELSRHHEKIYTIASRCGVFAKSDVQPLLNQGARKEDIAAGIFYAVVGQTVAGLAQGRNITGHILYLGGPLYFFPELRAAFDATLHVKGKCPEDALYYVAQGAALSGTGEPCTAAELRKRFAAGKVRAEFHAVRPLFTSTEEYEDFRQRHEVASLGIRELSAPTDRMYLGIDAGSTTVKMVLCDEDGNIFRPFYSSNHGNPIPLIHHYLTELYREYPHMTVAAAAVTGYGEELVKNAFMVDVGIVETVAHYTAAKKFRPDVDFILDIGGQDIKCFRIRNGAIDQLFLNEACSSGCGSFLQTFAAALGYSISDFAAMGLYADAPVDLGSRCTVFMNSAVKQAQKEGAGIENIAAGLSVSVVKNALYKVIRCVNADQLGEHIVVQGGTFLNDCVLRAFEQEIGRDVIRPRYAALMGAYGAALYAGERHLPSSTLLDAAGLSAFRHEVKTAVCNGCTNHCNLTVNTFAGGKRYIAGNRCSRPLGKKETDTQEDLYAEKLALLSRCRDEELSAGRKVIGIPMGLNFYELLPFFYAFFRKLGFSVLVSPFADRALYLRGQHTIPSDTACYPAKMMHGHIEWLLERHPDAIFYPDMTYNVEEGLGVNHYNCPVVAYYPQVLRLNVPGLKDTVFIDDFISIVDRRQFEKRMMTVVSRYFPEIRREQIHAATQCAYAAYDAYRACLQNKAQKILCRAAEEGKPVIVLAGRPYHVDPEINHGIHTLITTLGAAVVTEDSISSLVKPFPVSVRNQWSYHARLYAAAKYVAESKRNIHLVQLVSFGCGVDAITSDEVRSIVEGAGKVYTQIKIDEISNMGAVTIRLRSLFAMLKEKEKQE